MNKKKLIINILLIVLLIIITKELIIPLVFRLINHLLLLLILYKNLEMPYLFFGTFCMMIIIWTICSAMVSVAMMIARKIKFKEDDAEVSDSEVHNSKRTSTGDKK